MLRRDQRLCSGRDFRRVYRRGRSYAHPLLVLHVDPTRDGLRRVGFSVSRKLGGSVERNRVKRRLREAVRGIVDRTVPGYAAVVVGRRALPGASYADLAAAVSEAFVRAGLLAATPEDGVDPCAGSASG